MHRHLTRWGVLLLVLAAAAAAALATPARTAAAPTDNHTKTETQSAHGAKPKHAGPSRHAGAVRSKGLRRKAVRRKAVSAAHTRIGRPYRFGAVGPRAFDCSGLTRWSFNRAGAGLPRVSQAQARVGFGVKRSKIRAGDLVFFNTNGPGASHVGIATSRTTAISATSHGVRKHTIARGYWGAHYVGARRVTAV